jgi:ribosomal protein S18 acetylase RimI-like enzyme
MVASTSLRRQGLGRATVLTFLSYLEQHAAKILTGFATKEGIEECGIRQLKVKIGSKNERSIKLFESIGFVKVKEEPNYFGELELVLQDYWREELRTGAMLERWGVEGYREFGYKVERGPVKD